MSLCWCQSVDITLLPKRYVNEQQLFLCLFAGMTNTSKDMTKTTWTFLSELPTWSLKTCRTLSAGSANNRVVWVAVVVTALVVVTLVELLYLGDGYGWCSLLWWWCLWCWFYLWIGDEREEKKHYNKLKHLRGCGDLCFKGGNSDCFMMVFLLIF